MVSIAIPVYEMNSFGETILSISLEKIAAQTYKNIEVVISDHSLNDDIKKLCDSYKEKLKIIYLRNEYNRGSSSSNLNNALINCSGDIIKILMQDEYLCDERGIEKIKKIFDEENINWLATGCLYGTYPASVRGSMMPVYSNTIIESNNTLGSPSVITIKNSNIELFNEELLWVMDCEYYKRMHDRFGSPYILNECLVFITQHKDQVTSFLDIETKTREEKFLLQKYTH